MYLKNNFYNTFLNSTTENKNIILLSETAGKE